MRPEPRGMTLGDVMALSVGVAVAFAILRWPGGGGFLYLTPWGMAIALAMILAWSAAMAISAASIGRSKRFGRLIGPGEGIGFLLAALGFVILNQHRFLFAEDQIHKTFGIDFRTIRWGTALGWTIVILLGLGVLHGSSRRLPAWLASILVLTLLTLAIGGPFSTIQNQAPWLILPSQDTTNWPRFLILTQVCERIARTPLELLFAVPIVQLYLRRSQRRSWPWTEWAGPILGVPVLLLMIFWGNLPFPAMSPEWLSIEAFHVVWLGVVLALAWVIALGWNSYGQIGTDHDDREPEETTSPSTWAT